VLNSTTANGLPEQGSEDHRLAPYVIRQFAEAQQSGQHPQRIDPERHGDGQRGAVPHLVVALIQRGGRARCRQERDNNGAEQQQQQQQLTVPCTRVLRFANDEARVAASVVLVMIVYPPVTRSSSS
jgi:hypothetical protein